MNIERRFIRHTDVPIEIRMDGEGEGETPVLIHHSPPWDTLSVPLWMEDGKPVLERWQRGAFAEVLADGPDVRGLFNHNSSQLLGRTTNKTLLLEEDELGLRYELWPNLDASVGRNVVAWVKRGDLTGSSFAFRASGEAWDETEDSIIRTVTRASDLVDTGPVTFPAFPHDEEVGLRSAGHCDDAVSRFTEWREARKRSRVVVPELDEKTLRRMAESRIA